MLTVLDLFSGLGNMSRGLEQAGFHTKTMCEADPYARMVLEKNFPGVPIVNDVRDLHIHEGEYDIIAGGFPCQDISVAGKGKGLDGERSGIWSEFSRLIEEGDPKYVIIENSPNLRNRGLRRVLTDLWKSGYDAEWYCLEAGQFGAPHVRERIWIVAYPFGKGGERLVTNELLGEVRQGGWGSPPSLQQILHRPFGRYNSWPQPLLRREDDGTARRVDRLRLIGNSLYPAIPEFLGRCINKKESA